MSYEYPETPDLAVARNALEAAGYQVTPPRCPDCHGWGHPALDWAKRPTIAQQLKNMNEPCPRGCPVPGVCL